MDLPGHTELLAARTLLAGNVAERSTILAAAEYVWGAMFHRDEWPPALQGEADTLQRMLLRYGTIRMTVDTMNDAELTDLRAALGAFIEAAENAAG